MTTIRQLIDTGIATLFRKGDVVELRIPNAGREGTIVGYFDDFNLLAETILEYSGKDNIPAVYYTLNPVNPAYLARAANRAKPYSKEALPDSGITSRRWLLIDHDPTRPTGISATAEGKLKAKAKYKAVRAWLTDRGWPRPVGADSGNGFHLNYGVELPNDA